MGLVEGVGPAALIAKTKHLEGANSEDLTVGSPLDRSDDVIVRKRVVKLSTKLIPNAIFAIFSGGYDKVVGRVPVTSKNDTIVSLPANLLVGTWQGRLNDQVLVAVVQDGIAIG